MQDVYVILLKFVKKKIPEINLKSKTVLEFFCKWHIIWGSIFALTWNKYFAGEGSENWRCAGVKFCLIHIIKPIEYNL